MSFELDVMKQILEEQKKTNQLLKDVLGRGRDGMANNTQDKKNPGNNASRGKRGTDKRSD